MGGHSILMLPISQGVHDVTLFSDSSPLVEAPCESPLCSQELRKTEIQVAWFPSPCLQHPLFCLRGTDCALPPASLLCLRGEGEGGR